LEFAQIQSTQGLDDGAYDYICYDPDLFFQDAAGRMQFAGNFHSVTTTNGCTGQSSNANPVIAPQLQQRLFTVGVGVIVVVIGVSAQAVVVSAQAVVVVVVVVSAQAVVVVVVVARAAARWRPFKQQRHRQRRDL
jgi:hypothetical protein